jgi:hypothetical protein
MVIKVRQKLYCWDNQTLISCLHHISKPAFFVCSSQYPFFTLVAFDHHDMGLPVAWSIQKRETAEMIARFLQVVKEKCTAIRPSWMPACFIIDCADAEVSALKNVFPSIPIYFCTWHVRRYYFLLFRFLMKCSQNVYSLVILKIILCIHQIQKQIKYACNLVIVVFLFFLQGMER